MPIRFGSTCGRFARSVVAVGGLVGMERQRLQLRLLLVRDSRRRGRRPATGRRSRAWRVAGRSRAAAPCPGRCPSSRRRRRPAPRGTARRRRARAGRRRPSCARGDLEADVMLRVVRRAVPSPGTRSSASRSAAGHGPMASCQYLQDFPPPFRPVVRVPDRAAVVELQAATCSRRNRRRTPSAGWKNGARRSPRVVVPAVSGARQRSSKKPARSTVSSSGPAGSAGLVPDLEHGPVSQAREEQVIQRGQFLLMERVAAVQDHVAARSASGFGWISTGAWSAAAIALACRSRNSVARPADRQLRQHAADPTVAAGVAEQDEVAAAHVVVGDVRVVLDRQFAAEVAAPLVGEALQAGVGPRLHGGVPGFARAADAQERRGESVVDRPLQTGPLAVQQQAGRVRRDTPIFRRCRPMTTAVDDRR